MAVKMTSSFGTSVFDFKLQTHYLIENSLVLLEHLVTRHYLIENSFVLLEHLLEGKTKRKRVDESSRCEEARDGSVDVRTLHARPQARRYRLV